MNKPKPVLASPRRIINQKNPSNIPRYRANQLAVQNNQPNNRPKRVNNKQQVPTSKRNVKNSNVSKIPVKGSNKPIQKDANSNKAVNAKDDQKKFKEMVQLQLIVDPQHVEQMKRSQKLYEDQLKKEIEQKKKQILNNSNSGKIDQSNNSLSNSINSKNSEITIYQFSAQIPEVREEPFTIDLGPESIFDKSTVKTPLPGFSLRKNMNISHSPKPAPTFPLIPEMPPTNTRLDSASELIYQDGRRYSCPRSSSENPQQII